MGMHSTRFRAPAETSNRGPAIDRGFSLLEVLIFLAVTGIVSAMSYVAFAKVLPNFRADSAMDLVEAQMRQAREASVDYRRNVKVTFQGTNEIVTVRVNPDGSTTPMSDSFLPYGMVYTLFTGVPDTPDGYTNAYDVTFGCTSLPCSILFQSDGTVLNNSSGTYVNGSVFIGMPSQSLTARAITALATTGKIRFYRWNGQVWH